MADYTETQLDAYNTIRDEGGAIEFMVYPDNDIPSNPDAPWEGSNTEREPFPHVALLIPISPNAPHAWDTFGEQAIIPGHGLPFALVKGTQFRTATTAYQIEDFSVLRPDGVTPILYTCKVTSWVRL